MNTTPKTIIQPFTYDSIKRWTKSWRARNYAYNLRHNPRMKRRIIRAAEAFATTPAA